MRPRALLVLVTLFTAGCGATLATWGSPVGPETVWYDMEGNQVPSDVIYVFRGADHCQWQDTLFFTARWDRMGVDPPPIAGRDQMYVYRPDRVRSDQRCAHHVVRDRRRDPRRRTRHGLPHGRCAAMGVVRRSSRKR